MIALALAACGSLPPPDPGVLVVVQEQQPAWIRNFNPLITTGAARWPTRCGIYEPLAIWNGAAGEWVPWLAESFRYRDDQTLEFVLRDGLRWSDGEALGAGDVAYTFRLVTSRPELDLTGLSSFVASVDAEDDRTVVFHLSRPYSPGLTDLAHQPILPEHVWRDVPDPLAFANPDPVGSGPFTEVRVFRPAVFELGRNPYYWQPVDVDALRFPAMASNDQVTLGLMTGEVDWAGAFVPAIDRIYVGRDPADNHYWFPPVGDGIFLYANTTRPPLDDRRVREAMSRAIDRELLVKVAMYDYTHPADATGLSDGYAAWKSPAAVAAGDWVRFDRERARELLDQAGLVPGPDGMRRGRDGEPLDLELAAVTGWSDWVRASQVIARDLREVGLDVRLRSYDFGAWFDRLQRGTFTLSLGWSPSGPTPYPLYQGLMSARAVRPVGQPAQRGWARYGSAEADELLDRFERTTDLEQQRAIAARLQELFVREVPAIPLFPSPSWGEYRTERFVGFPSADDPYARLSPNHFPDPLLVMTHLRRRSPTVARIEP
jgi:peptide/nickel transport system substrate-binding protein